MFLRRNFQATLPKNGGYHVLAIYIRRIRSGYGSWDLGQRRHQHPLSQGWDVISGAFRHLLPGNTDCSINRYEHKNDENTCWPCVIRIRNIPRVLTNYCQIWLSFYGDAAAACMVLEMRVCVVRGVSCSFSFVTYLVLKNRQIRCTPSILILVLYVLFFVLFCTPGAWIAQSV